MDIIVGFQGTVLVPFCLSTTRGADRSDYNSDRCDLDTIDWSVDSPVIRCCSIANRPLSESWEMEMHKKTFCLRLPSALFILDSLGGVNRAHKIVDSFFESGIEPSGRRADILSTSSTRQLINPTPAKLPMTGAIPTVDPASVGFSAERLARLSEFLEKDYVGAGKLAGTLALVARKGQIAHVAVSGMGDVERGTPLKEVRALPPELVSLN